MTRMVWARWMVSIVIAIILIGSLAVTASAADLRRIVVFREGTLVEVQQQVVALTGSSVLHILSLIDALAIELPAVGTNLALALLQALPGVLRVDDDPLVELQGQGGDGQGADDGRFVTSGAAPAHEFYPWGIDWIGAADVQEQYPELEGDEVKVALIDTGIDPTHPDLQQNIIGCYNALARQNPHNCRDDNGHGTFVAGTVAAQLNDRGVIGVAPRVKIYVLKALDQDGKGRTSDVINALQHVPRDIRLTAGSCGTDLVSPSFEDAIHRLYQSGMLMVFSAGNYCTANNAQGQGGDASCTTTPPADIKFPARYPGVIAVGASDANDRVPGFSRSGRAMAEHGVVAPGVNIFSTNLEEGYGWMSGTSASTPHVTGAVALALQLRPRLSYKELWDLLRGTATDLGYPREQQGAGRINVKKDGAEASIGPMRIETSREGGQMTQHARTVLLVALWVSCVLLVHGPCSMAATSESPEPGTKFSRIYRRMLPNNPPTLDPALTVDVYGRAVVTQLFDGLVQFDAHLNPIPALAEFWEASQDRRTWTFSLRRGVTFHHGREVTADDFIYSFTRLLKAAKLGPMTDLLHRIQGAGDFMRGPADRVQGLQAVDRYTLQIVLEEPFAPLLAVLGLANAAVVPREVVEQQGEQFARAPVGTGPFKFVRWEPDKEIVLQANDQYYEGRPFLDTVVFTIGGTFEEKFADFLKGNLEDALIPSEKTDEVYTDPQYQKFQRVRRPTLSLLYIGFNTQHKPFDDKRVRQAFNYAVDKETIVRDITKMGSLPAAGALPPSMPGHDPNLRGYDYNPTKARQLLAEAGYPNGTGFPVVQLWTASRAASTKVEMAVYQRYLAEVGVQMDIRFEHDWPTYLKMLEQGQCSMFRLSWSARIPDPDDSLWHLLHSKNHRVYNHMFYHNPRVDALLEQARQVLDLTQRIALYREVEQLVMADAPWITQHYHALIERLYQPYVKGMEVSPLGDWAVLMKKIWFEKHRPEDSSRTKPDVQPRQ